MARTTDNPGGIQATIFRFVAKSVDQSIYCFFFVFVFGKLSHNNDQMEDRSGHIWFWLINQSTHQSVPHVHANQTKCKMQIDQFIQSQSVN